MYKRIFEGKNTVLFDLDGTVIDSEYAWYKAFETVINTIAPDALDEAQEIMLRAGVQIIDKWSNLRDRGLISNTTNAKDLAETTKNEYLKLLQLGAIEVRAGFWELAAELKLQNDYKLALVTNTSRNVTESVLKSLAFGQTFDLILCGDEVKTPKPDPEIYLTALKTLGIKAKDALVFEDSVTGVTSAVKAGIDTVVIWDGRNYEKDYPQDVLGFVADFTPFPGNLDKTIKDIIRDYAKSKTQK